MIRALPQHTRPIVAVLAAALLPILVFPEVLLQGQSFYFEDLSWFHLPLRVLIADLWQSGTWPLWNPYSYNGFTLLAEFQVGALSPQNWLFLLPVAPYQALNMLVLCQFVVAGFGAYVLARVCGVSSGASLLAALSYACGGYIMAQVVDLNLLSGSAWAPLVLALLISSLETRSLRDAVLAGIVLAMQLLSSHPQIPFYTFILVGVFALYGIVRAYLRSPTAPLHVAMRAALFPAVTILIALGLSAPQLATTFELIPLSRREQGLPLGYQEYLSLPPTEALTLIFPRLFLWPLDIWRSPPLYDVFHFYIGLIPLVCAGLSILRHRESMVRICWLLVLVSVVLALGQYTPVYAWVTFLPFISFFRIPSRWLFVTAIALIVLVGKGADAFYSLACDLARARTLKRLGVDLSLLFFGITLALPAALLVRPLNADTLTLLQDADIFSFERVAPRSVIFYRLWPEAVAFTLLAGVSLIAFWLLVYRRRAVYPFALLSIALTFVDLFAAGGEQGIDPSYWNQSQPLLTWLQAQHQSARIFSVGGYFDVVPRLGDEQPGGVHVLASSGESDLPINLQRTEDFWSGLSFVRALQVSSTNWLVVSDPPPSLWNRFGERALRSLASLRKVWQSDQVSVYAVPAPLPRAYVIYDIVAARSASEALQQLGAPDFDAQHSAVVEDQTIASHQSGLALSAAMITLDSPTHLRLEADAVSDGVLVLTDTYYPGWRVWVDGAERNILRTNYSFKGIMLSAGHHTIELMYEPKSFELGLTLAGITSVLVAAGVLFNLRRPAGHGA